MVKYGLVCASALALCFSAAMSPASAQSNAQKKFVSKAQGNWCGPGEIVAGKYNDTRFTCEINLTANSKSTTLEMSGTCRVGVFPKPMKGNINFQKNTAKGQFFGDSPKDLLEITAGKFSANTAELTIKRDNIDGNVSFALNGANALTSTVSVLAGLNMIPVINMRFKKCDREN